MINVYAILLAISLIPPVDVYFRVTTVRTISFPSKIILLFAYSDNGHSGYMGVVADTMHEDSLSKVHLIVSCLQPLVHFWFLVSGFAD